MKTQRKYVTIFLLFSVGLFGQNSVRALWGDYYYLNDEYEKAIAFFETYKGKKSLVSRRHWALAYLKKGQIEKAMLTYTPVVNSADALVEDYYIYADLLTHQPKLANEYRVKAFQLSWDRLGISLSDTERKALNLKPSYTLHNLKGNSTAADFGMIFPIRPNDSIVFFLSEQKGERKSNRVLKGFQSQYPIYDFFQAKLDLKHFRLKEKKSLRNTVNSYFQEGPGTVDRSGKWLYFTQSAKRLDKENNVLLKLYSISLDDLERQTIPQALNLVPQTSSAMHPSISSDGEMLYFSSDMPGGFGGMDLYRATWKEGEFQEVENLGPDINTEADEVFPFSHRNDFLFYASNAKTKEGKLDVMMAHNRIEKRWESFLLKQNINTTVDDFSFAMDPEQQWAWFSSNREGGVGQDDLYLFAFTPKIEGLPDQYRYAPSDTLIVAHENVQKNDRMYAYTQDPLQRLIERKVILETPPKNGKLQFNANGTFWYKNQKPLQLKDSFAYSISTVKGNSQPIWVQLEREAVKELPEDLRKPLLPIYYALDASNILEQYKARVEKVVVLMQKYPDLEIELRSYTDCRGPEAYNLALSKRRTESILDYVKKRILRPERIYGDGYGEVVNEGDSSINECSQLTASMHQENRKTTFTVIRIKK